MKRLMALLLALGIFLTAGPVLVEPVRADDEKKEAKKDDKKDEKKDEKKEEKKDDKASDAAKEELQKLSGTFILVSFERDGKKSSDDELKKMKVLQKGAEWSFHLGDEITQGKDTVYPDKNPKEIDSVYTNGPAKNKVVKGIYKIEGDTITYCWAEPDKDRPKEFATKADSGLTLMVLKRLKEDKPQEKEKAKEEKKEENKDN